jgi:DNA polymerase
LLAQLEFIKPKVIMALGQEAYTLLTGDYNFEEVRGHRVMFQNYTVVPIYHPQYLLRNPELKKVTLGDLQMIKSCL